MVLRVHSLSGFLLINGRGMWQGEHMPKVNLQEVHGTEQHSQAHQKQQQKQNTQPPAQHHGGVPAQDAHQPHTHQQGEKLHGAR